MKRLKWLIVTVSMLLAAGLCGATASAENAESIVKDKACAEALSFVEKTAVNIPDFSIWSNAEIESTETLYEPSGQEVTALNFNVAQNGVIVGYFIMDIDTLKIVEFAKLVSPYYSEEKTEGVKYLYAPLEHIAVYPGEEDAVILKSVKIDEASALEAAKNDTALSVAAGGVTPKGSGVVYRYISGVPDYQQVISCIPTAIGIVVGYWDAHGYPDLFSDSYSAMITAISNLMDSQNGGHTSNNNIPYGAETYCHQTYPNDFDCTNIWGPAFGQVASEILASRPCLVGFASGSGYFGSTHMTACVGYYYETTETDRYIIIHDGTYGNGDIYTLWGSYNDFMAKIVP